MLAALLLSVYTLAPWVLAGYGAGSFALYTLWMRGQWTAQRTFGAANRVTSVRLLLAVFMLTTYTLIPTVALAALGLLILALDGVDGRLARKHHTTGLYGATYDVEVDAFYTTALPLLLVVLQGVGAWVMLVGAWRYIYLLLLRLAPPRHSQVTSTLLGRWSYGVSITCLSCAMIVPEQWAARLALIGAAVTSASFLTSLRLHYGSKTPSKQRLPAQAP